MNILYVNFDSYFPTEEPVAESHATAAELYIPLNDDLNEFSLYFS